MMKRRTLLKGLVGSVLGLLGLKATPSLGNDLCGGILVPPQFDQNVMCGPLQDIYDPSGKPISVNKTYKVKWVFQRYDQETRTYVTVPGFNPKQPSGPYRILCTTEEV